MRSSTLLIVDDEPANLTALSQLLSPSYQVRACKSGEQALQAAVGEPRPDLILLDVMMPGMDGYAVLAGLLEDERTRDIPVIFVTALDSELDEEKGLGLGAVDYIRKPVKPAIVLARVKTHLELKEARDRLKRQNVSLEAEVARRIRENLLIMQEKEALESQLCQAQKLEAIGTLAGGIAHDFNNILSPIIGYTEMVLGDMPESSPSKADLKHVLVAARRARDLVRQILSFSRLGKEDLMQPVSISQIVKEAMKLLKASLPATIEIRQSLQSGTVMADATQIHQVVVNLCTNAAHAMDNKGVLDVSLRKLQVGDLDSAVPAVPDLEPGPYLELRVSDTGHGMDAETVQRIFDPYFTTKDVGKGTGLGLSVVQNIVKRHGGEITVQSRPDKGTVFCAYFPMVLVEAAVDMPVPDRLSEGKERILFVDDEPMIAEISSRLLERLGYLVIAKTNPLEALAFFQSSPESLDLIITDYTMPYMTGKDLVQEILKIRPDMPIIMCTGFNESFTEQGAKAMGMTELAVKPLERGQLAKLVRKTLDARPQ